MHISFIHEFLGLCLCLRNFYELTWCFALSTYCLSVLSYYATDEGSLELLKHLAKTIVND